MAWPNDASSWGGAGLITTPGDDSDANVSQAADREESFEDAVDGADTVDAVSERSLTKRSASASKPPTHDDEHDTPSDGVAHHHTHAHETEAEPADEHNPMSPRESSPLSRRLSTTSNLDNVNLDDEAATAADGTNALSRATKYTVR